MPPTTVAGKHGSGSGATRLALQLVRVRPLGAMFLRGLYRWAMRAVISAVPAVTIMKDLVLAGLPLELYEENRLDLGSFTGGRPCVDRVNSHALGKQVELGHQA